MTQHDAPRTGNRALTIWRDKPAIILWLYVLLLLGGSASGPLGHAAGMAPRAGTILLVSWLVTFWLIWRVWRRGQISHILIILGSGLGCINAALHVSKHPAALILLAIYAGQVTLLLSPALSRHTGPQADDAAPCA